LLGGIHPTATVNNDRSYRRRRLPGKTIELRRQNAVIIVAADNDNEMFHHGAHLIISCHKERRRLCVDCMSATDCEGVSVMCVLGFASCLLSQFALVSCCCVCSGRRLQQPRLGNTHAQSVPLNTARQHGQPEADTAVREEVPNCL